MSIQQSDVLKDLGTRNEPVDVRALASALGCEEGTAELNVMLNGLVRNHLVQRHHKSDGILRYSLLSKGTAKPAPVAPVRHVVSHNRPSATVTVTKAARPGSLEEKLLAMLSDTPVTRMALTARGIFSDKQVSNLLSRLRMNGLAVKSGTSPNIKWARAPHAVVPDGILTTAVAKVASASPIPPAATVVAELTPASDPAAPATPAPVPRAEINMAELLRTNVIYAEAARDAYVESVVDPAIYTRLQESVAAAQRVRNAFMEDAP